MFLVQLEISNFRGIKSSNISFPLDTRLICMIGAGDGTKSTILKAIEWLLWPSWNLNVIDSDFFNSDISVSIVIRGTFTEIPKTLLSEDKFGLYLRRNGVKIEEDLNDEPVDDQPVCLTIQLSIDSSLEPKWEVICNHKASKPISYSERQCMTIGSVGSNCEKDMMWNRYSVLQKYANTKGVLRDAFTAILRKAADDADFHKLDEVSAAISSVGMQYGVELSTEIKSKLLIQNNVLTSSVGLFEDGAPLSQRGLGSQRLLSMGLNINATSDGAILLIDEIETGLEPYRLRSLINEFRKKPASSGQIFMTTHSPVVVAECTTSELFIIQSNNGVTTFYSLHNIDGLTNEVIQKEVRRNPEAFLCKRIIVCEGKTEIGFIRALDDYVSNKYSYRMACEGVGTALGGGSDLFSFATFLAKCGYEVCILMDSDLTDIEEMKLKVKQTHGIPTYDWDKGNSIEEQIFSDVSTSLAEEVLHVAILNKGIDSISSKLIDLPICVEDGKIKILDIMPEQKRKIGTIAKHSKSEWYKRIDLGEEIGEIIFSNWDKIDDTTTIHKTISNLMEWVKSND